MTALIALLDLSAQSRRPAHFDGKDLLTTTQPGNFERAQSATIGDNFVFSPNTLNAIHFTFNLKKAIGLSV